MGFEEFNVRLEKSPQSAEAIRKALEQDARFQQVGSPSSHLYEGYFRDGLHVIEVALSAHGTLSMRFSLCHPPSVDRVFTDLAKLMATNFSMTIVTGIPGNHEAVRFAPPKFPGFDSVYATAIRIRRAEWTHFCPEVAGLSVEEAIKRFVAPRYLPRDDDARSGQVE